MNKSMQGILDAMWWNFGSTREPRDRGSWRTRSYQKVILRPNRIKKIKPTTVFDPDKTEVII